MKYRRNRVQGGTFFFTVVTANRAPVFSSPAVVDCLRTSFSSVISIWTLPEGDHDFSRRWRLIKTGFTKGAKDIPGLPLGVDGSLWQKRFWEHTILDGQDFERHVDYIHFNPVKHGYVARASDWPYSSFHRYVREGVLQRDWAVDEDLLVGVGRE